jgi:MFS family permease
VTGPARLAPIALLVLGAIDAAGYSVIGPTVPAIARAEDAGPAVMGALVASFAAGTLVGYFLAGLVVARRGVRTALLLGIGLIVLGSLAFVLEGGLAAYFVGRVTMGLGSGGLWIALTFAMLERSPGREYVQMSRLLAAYSLGALLGPALAALGGVRAPFLAYMLLAAATVPLVFMLGAPAAAGHLGSGRQAFRLPGFWLAGTGVLFSILALGVVEGVLPLHFASALSQAQIAGLLVGTSLVVAASAVAAGGRRPRPLLAATLVLVVVGIGLAGAGAGIGLCLPALALAGLGIGLGETAAAGILLEGVGTQRIVMAMVVWSQLGLLGYMAGPLAGGAVAAGLGYGWLVLVPLAAGVPVVVAFARSRR